jgi:hypothetical protein
MLLLLALALLLSACAGPQIEDVKQKYLLARMEYNDILTEYLDLKAIQTAPVRAEWKAKVDPKFKALGVALDAWKGALEAADGDAVSAERTFMTALAEVKAMTVLESIFKEEGQ